MADTQLAYARGDSVISTQCLVTAPTCGEVRVEIPAASRGTVVSVDPEIRWAPYCVVFEAGHGGLVEMQVSAQQIGRVASHDPLVPIVDQVVDEFTPSVSYPDPWCRPLHVIIVMESLFAYGLVVQMQPRLMIEMTAGLLVLMYGHQLYAFRRMTIIPMVLQRIDPCDHEVLTVKRLAARRSAYVDVLVVVVIGTLLYHFVSVRAHGSWPDVSLFVAHVLATGFVLLVKLAMHQASITLTPKTD
jgi:hypothetical protein